MSYKSGKTAVDFSRQLLERGMVQVLMDSLDPVDVGEQMVKLALECLAPLSYHPVIRETIINIDVAVFVILFKESDLRKILKF